MRTIGLIGGMSWESTVPYYRQINEGVRQQLGGLHSAKLVLYSVDFHEIERLQQDGDWTQVGIVLADAARALEAAGAEFLVLCTNTMHKLAGVLEAAVSIPLLHIADATAAEINAAGLRRIGLLGTRYTMEQDFYVERLRDRGLDVLIPGEAEREIVHRVIYDELCRGRIDPDSRIRYRAIIAGLVERGAQAIILGCTEIGLLVDAADSRVPLFDTTRIHALAAVAHALESPECPERAGR
jgi:aspartate racemase